MPDNQRCRYFVHYQWQFLASDKRTYFCHCHLPVLLCSEISAVNFTFPNYKPYVSSSSVHFFAFSICALTNLVGKVSTATLSLYSVHILSALSTDVCHLNTYSSVSKCNCKNFAGITIFRTCVCKENGLLLYCKWMAVNPVSWF